MNLLPIATQHSPPGPSGCVQAALSPWQREALCPGRAEEFPVQAQGTHRDLGVPWGCTPGYKRPWLISRAGLQPTGV